MNLDWRRLKAVVLESDDWGLCAWSPDEQAHRVLADTPSFRGPTGQIYGRSTLESAQDVDQLAEALLEFRGGDGFPPVWQANTVVAAPDYARLVPPLFQVESLPLAPPGETPSRWRRPGLGQAVDRACAAGVWWPELHGLHHLPERAWLTALRRGAADARRAHEQQSPVCQAVEGSGEYDPTEPAEVRCRNLEAALERFTGRFGRAPLSLCPPDYRWDEWLEREAEARGVTILQGKAEQAGHALPRLRRLLLSYRWPNTNGGRFYPPPRIAFEPRGAGTGASRLGAAAVQRAARAAWWRGQPAVVSSHRLNYAHLDAEWSVAGRAALQDLLARLSGDGAVFLTDAELRDLALGGWSVRAIGEKGALLRYYGVPREQVRFPAPPGVARVAVREGRGPEEAGVTIQDGEVVVQANVGEYLLEWRHD